MVSNSFQQTTPKRRAAWLALLAILLIVVAPLISVSLQKDPMSAMPGMHHAMMMDSSPASMAMMHSTDGATPTGHELPLDHAEACGYCVLLAHVPGLIFALALFVAMLLRRIRLPASRPVLKHWRYFPWLYPETRAPPRLSAFSLS
ncbi:DUF2946 domain-containing protein [Klebsiella quasipneumoniae subsp. similipneumoniae]|uniref:DUF2946 domain-containing protein n=1 Tax=Klebsiella quasipneumoniae TaxID=1463165 RepID=UPI001F26DCEF|nr:DUF2946 domain-containing protein [Klebsiella quasipneumoniae]MCF2309106.1 DUF2946 domain-containing protein [Klebsiella quasipneumoniae subsp. similipneumoniae]HBT6275708.1 DUF2946 domain-containing protein [Klebsiella quasipneumoniae]HDE1080425.1 DUF2946 domain-containing protein [Klebsiella quasipneumoniae]HDE1496232.1 DUF2946 domain-containing protein [Klebsiella quasipneumoniae]HDE1501719.1 DUF2946 domain-containing protein [Klebsiella quasipneumoniae]